MRRPRSLCGPAEQPGRPLCARRLLARNLLRATDHGHADDLRSHTLPARRIALALRHGARVPRGAGGHQHRRGRRGLGVRALARAIADGRRRLRFAGLRRRRPPWRDSPDRHHDRRRDRRRRQRSERLRGRWGAGHGGRAQLPDGRRPRRRGRPLHRRPGQLRGPQGRRNDGSDQHGGRDGRDVRFHGRRRPGHGGRAQPPGGSRPRWGGQPLHRRQRELRRPQGHCDGHDQHGGGNGRLL